MEVRACIPADLRDPADILNDPVPRDVLDFSRPVALMLIAILHMIPDEEKPAEIVATLLDALPPERQASLISELPCPATRLRPGTRTPRATPVASG